MSNYKFLERIANKTGPARWSIELGIKAAFAYLRALFILHFPKLAPKWKGLSGRKRDTRHVLIVSYYFPPYKSRYGTQRISKFAKYLSKLGWRVTVLTTAPRNDNERDVAAVTVPQSIRVVTVEAMTNHVFVNKNVIPPDDFIYWVSTAEAAIRKIVETQDVSLILATAPPYSNMLAAGIASVKSGIPLVSDFRDPWTQIDVVWVLRNRISHMLSGLLERSVLRISVKNIMADELLYAEDFFIENSGEMRNKTVSVRNGYDDEDFSGIPDASLMPPNEKFSICYVGVFYTDENFKNFVAPMKRWAELYPEDLDKIRIDYAGPDGELLKAFDELALDVVDHGYVPHRRAIEIRNQSSVQLFGQPAAFKPHVLSGKIYEMIRISRPILAMTFADGAVSRLVAETRTGKVVDPGDVDAILRVLKGWFDEWQRTGSIAFDSDQIAIAGYSRECQTGKLSDVLDGVLDSARQ